jgi:hypothetical protein
MGGYRVENVRGRGELFKYSNCEEAMTSQLLLKEGLWMTSNVEERCLLSGN